MSKLDEIKEEIDRLNEKLKEAMLEEKHANVLEENTFWEKDEELYYLCNTPGGIYTLTCLNDGKFWSYTGDVIEKAFGTPEDFQKFKKISRERARQLL